MRLVAALTASVLAIGPGCSRSPDFSHTIGSYGPCQGVDRCVVVMPNDLEVTNEFEVVSVVEDVGTVQIEIRALPFRGADFGLGGIPIDLKEPLGDRVVVDARTGDPVPIEE